MFILKVKNVIPRHDFTFELLKGTPDELIKSLEGIATQVVVMTPADVRIFQVSADLKNKAGAI